MRRVTSRPKTSHTSCRWVAPFSEFFAANGGYRNSRAYRQLMITNLGVDLRELLDTGAR